MATPADFKAPTHLIGISCTTTAATANVDIGALWAQARASKFLTIGEPVWAAYHTYVDGGMGFTLTVGRAGTADEVVPAGQTRVAVPEQTWRHEPTDGSIGGLQQVWGAIWARWPDGGPRTFQVDLERWFMAPDGTMQADIYLGVRA